MTIIPSCRLWCQRASLLGWSPVRLIGGRKGDKAMKRIRTRAGFVVGAVVLVLTTPGLTARLNAQETRGKIAGRIADTSKAILPGATVTVTDVARNTVATATS